MSIQTLSVFFELKEIPIDDLIPIRSSSLLSDMSEGPFFLSLVVLDDIDGY